jgi:hypothetical protein
MLSSILSSSALLSRALLVVLMLVGVALPAVAAVPKASDGTLTVRNGATSLVTLKGTSDKGTTLTYAIVDQGTKGIAALNVTGRPTVASYAVKSGVNPVGTDQFTFRVTDSNGRVSNIATIRITFVNNTIITWAPPTPIIYGTPLSTTATATAGGVPVAGTFVYTPALGTVLGVGTTRVTAVFTPATAGAAVTKALNVKVNAATLTVTSTATKIYKAALPTLTPTYSGFVNGDTSATVLTGAPKLTTTATATSVVGSYPITVAKGTLKSNTNYALKYVAGTLSVTPATATVTLSGLAYTYDGFGHGAVVTTSPALTFSVTYDGSTLLPVDAGSYAVVATVTNPNYSGSATAALVIAKADATIQLSDLSHTYNTQSHPAGITTIPADLATSVTYAGSLTTPVNAGSYAVNATITDPNYNGVANSTLVIAKASAEVVLAGLAHTYDGASHVATATTVPADLPLVISYNSSDVAPVNAGTYEVVVSILDPNYVGSASDALVIAKAPAGITLTDLSHTYDSAAHAVTATTAPLGLDVAITYNGASTAPIAAGSYAVAATINDANRQGSASGTLTIAQATQTITVSSLTNVTVGAPDQTLTGTATSGLSVTLSVTGPAEIVADKLHVTGAGSITVTATQDGDANWFAAPTVVQTITAVDPIGTGLLGSYFANKNLAGTPVLTRVDSLINFDWVNSSPHSLVPADLFSVRWDGEIVPRFNEAYTLTFRTDDGVRVWLDGQLIVNYWSDRSAGDSTYTFTAQAGKRYRTRVEFYENGGQAVAKILWRSASEPSGPIPTTQLYPTAPDTSGPIGTGTGLNGSYFANETVTGVPVVTRIDAGVNFDWAGSSPATGVPVDSFSARWSGEIQPRYSEPYTLTLRTDDGVRMWLDGQLVINDWILRGAATSTYTFTAVAGQRYAIRIEFYEHQGSAVSQLGWYSAHEYAGPVQATQLYPLPTPVIDVADITQTVAEGEAVALSGTVTNTGSAIMAYAWTQVSGPGTASFAPANQTSTVARFPVAGSYVMKLWAFNGHVTVSDTTTVMVASPDVSTDLVAYYAFDEADGTFALDSSGKQHTGNIVGATRTTGKSRGALRFNGTSDVWALNNEDLDVPIQALTLAVWLKPDTTLAQMAHPWPMPIYRAQYEDSSGYALMVTTSETDQFGLRLHHQAGFGQVVESTTASPLSPNSWMHVAGVYDGSTAKLYLDGVLVQSVATGPITLRNAPYSPLVLGYGFEGVMDEVRIYHRALSRTDLFGLAQDGSDRRTPGVNAGADKIVTLLAPTTTLAGVATDDANSGATLVPTWKQVSGPATATFSNVHTLAPQVTFPATGTYRFMLEVSDGVLIGRDDLRVEVTDGSVDLVSGLILHYKADEGTGTLVADSSGLGHDGTYLGNPQWSADGQLLGALALDGSSNVTTPAAADLGGMTRMTLSVWMRADRALVDMTHPYPFVLNHTDYANNRGFALMTVLSETNTFGFRLHTGTGRREVTMDGVPSGTWVHVVATFDGQTMRLYRDGVLLDVNVTGPIPLPSLDAPLQVGEGFEGLLDDVRIYDRALSPTEVQSLHALPPLAASG